MFSRARINSTQFARARVQNFLPFRNYRSSTIIYFVHILISLVFSKIFKVFAMKNKIRIKFERCQGIYILNVYLYFYIYIP